MARESKEQREELIELNEKARQHLGLYMLMGDRSLNEACHDVAGVPLDEYIANKFLFGFIDLSEAVIEKILNLKVTNVHTEYDDVIYTTSTQNDFLDYLKNKHSH